MRGRACIAMGLLLLLLGACESHSVGAEPTPEAQHAGRAAPPKTQHEGHAGHEAPSGPPVPSVRGQEAPPGSPAPSVRGHEGVHGTMPATPEGYSTITLSPERVRGLGLATAPVEEGELTHSLRTVGVVTLDETKTSHVHSKVRGWIESISVDFIGKRVRAGSPLVTIYSQEVYAAELEFLAVLEQPAFGQGLSGELAAAERASRERLVAAARKRLSLWDVPKSEIRRLERTRTPQRTFTLVAPRTGIVLAKQAIAGMFVEPSLELYLISDIRKLWVLADIYASDIQFVKVGDPAQLSIEGAGSEPIVAKVVFIPPTIDEATRTLKVRFELDNRSDRLRPGAFATVEMSLGLGKGLSIPEDAVILAGPRAIVFVVRGDEIEPREIQLGPNVAGRYRVDQGLHAGERVATGAQFLLDSESRLRASSAPGGAHAGH